jgi:hypothetical protein
MVSGFRFGGKLDLHRRFVPNWFANTRSDDIEFSNCPSHARSIYPSYARSIAGAFVSSVSGAFAGTDAAAYFAADRVSYLYANF